MFFFNGYVFLREEGASLVAQMVKNLPTVPETQVRSLGWEDPLEEEMATHSSTLAWKIPWTEEPGRLHEVTKSDMTEWLSHFWGDSPKEGHPFENEFPYWLCCGLSAWECFNPMWNTQIITRMCWLPWEGDICIKSSCQISKGPEGKGKCPWEPYNGFHE